ncbi:hypothetical protein E1287_00880 [Actinomadura sp. KC06]|uniref:hypothetical protein n=1 Tax=Actinomadura sp. KC06 TaxID=2530369 RepID=UPI001049B799|nr:hypothetical protein [Actinomadura sp. KC06]TDD40558.1 hypothetical protein E1287_00880 [Actinomadura sp. KC06]
MIIRRRRRGGLPDAAAAEKGAGPRTDGTDWISFRPRPDTEALLEVLHDRLRAAAAEVTAHDGR